MSRIPVKFSRYSSIGKKLKLKISDFLFNDNPERLNFGNSSASINDWKIDILWMLTYLVNFHTVTLFWPGRNSTLIEPMQYMQKVWYLPQVNQSPTNHSTLAEIMHISLQIVQKAMKNSIAVTDDLAIAKIAMKI